MESIIHKEGLEGNPMNFLLAGGLAKFEVISEQIMALSPYDGIELPTMMFFPHMEAEVDFTGEEFVELLASKTNYIRNSILTKRIQEQRRHGTRI